MIYPTFLQTGGRQRNEIEGDNSNCRVPDEVEKRGEDGFPITILDSGVYALGGRTPEEEGGGIKEEMELQRRRRLSGNSVFR